MAKGDRILRIRGKRWRLRFVSHLGENRGICDNTDRIIRIVSNQEQEVEMDTIIHEILHAALWDLDEEAVHDTANAISAALWRVGYRRSL
jgi:ABC-type phosphate transport system ATPase subunit